MPAPPPAGPSAPAETVVAWTASGIDHVVFSDQDVAPLLRAWGPEAVTLFQAIRIPACRADLARLVLLHAYGGLYVDVHCAPGEPHQLRRVFESLDRHELVLFDESAHLESDRHAWLLNSVLAAQPRSDLVEAMIRRALDNLAAHQEAERAAGGRVDYSIYKLTGPWMIWHELFQRTAAGGQLRPDLQDRVLIWSFGTPGPQPVLTYRHNGYRTPANHWSRRQRTEPLFARPDPCGPAPSGAL